MIVMMLVNHLRRRRRRVERIVLTAKTTGRKRTRIVPVLILAALKTCG